MPRSTSNRLNRAKDGGAYITTSTGEPVEYDSRGPRDDKPWKTADGRRFSGTECKPNVP